MRRVDQKFLNASVIWTVLAITGYMFLSLIGKRYSNNVTTSFGFENIPVIFIDTLQSYWWFGYLFYLGILGIEWIIKRLISD